MRFPGFALLATSLLVLTSCSGGDTGGARPAPPATSVAAAEANERELVGTWDYEFDRAGVRTMLRNFSDLVEEADSVVVRLAFVDDNEWWLGFLFDGELVLLHGVPEGDGGAYTVDGDQISMTGDHGRAEITYRWTLTGQRLVLVAVEQCAVDVATGDTSECTRDRSELGPLMLLVTEHTYVRSGDDVTY